jgi:hypothetical protein
LDRSNVGHPGFVPNQHLVRYCLKRQELEKIVVKLDAGTVDKSPAHARLKSFWGRIAGSTDQDAKARSLKKAWDFMTDFLKSLIKHNNQFVSSDLLFLGAFGEQETGFMVARMLQSVNKSPESELCANNLLVSADETRPRTFKSKIHKQTIYLEKFGDFLVDICWENAPDATKTRNFELVCPIVLQLAGGKNIWDGSKATKADQNISSETTFTLVCL